MKRNNLHTTIEINYPCMAEQPRTHILQIGPSNCPARIYLSSCMCRCGMCLKLKRNDGRSKCPKFNQAPVIWHCNNWYGMFTCVFSPFFFFFSCEISHTSVAKIGKKVVFFLRQKRQIKSIGNKSNVWTLRYRATYKRQPSRILTWKWSTANKKYRYIHWLDWKPFFCKHSRFGKRENEKSNEQVCFVRFQCHDGWNRRTKKILALLHDTNNFTSK